MKTLVRFLLVGALLTAAGMYFMGSCISCASQPDTRSDLKRCMDGCGLDQINCGYTCKGDAECSRTCAKGYQQCLSICERHGG